MKFIVELKFPNTMGEMATKAVRAEVEAHLAKLFRDPIVTLHPYEVEQDTTVVYGEPGTYCTWKCPDCLWEQRAHPKYGWSKDNEHAVVVHTTMLCPRTT